MLYRHRHIQPIQIQTDTKAFWVAIISFRIRQIWIKVSFVRRFYVLSSCSSFFTTMYPLPLLPLHLFSFIKSKSVWLRMNAFPLELNQKTIRFGCRHSCCEPLHRYWYKDHGRLKRLLLTFYACFYRWPVHRHALSMDVS